MATTLQFQVKRTSFTGRPTCCVGLYKVAFVALLLSSCEAETGSIRRVEKYWPNGNPQAIGLEVKTIMKFDDWARIGLWREYFSNGQLSSAGEYINLASTPIPDSPKKGWWVYWYEDGTPKQICQYLEVPIKTPGSPFARVTTTCYATDIAGPALTLNSNGSVNPQASGYFLAGARQRDLTSAELAVLRSTIQEWEGPLTALR